MNFSYHQMRGKEKVSTFVSFMYLEWIILIIFCITFFYWFYQRNNVEYELSALSLLQKSNILWCLISLDEKEQKLKKNSCICSTKFFELIQQKSLSWNTLLEIFGRDNYSLFQSCIQKVLKTEEPITYPVFLHKNPYKLSMSIVTTSGQWQHSKVSFFKEKTGNIIKKGILFILEDQTHILEMKKDYTQAVKKMNDLMTIFNTLPFPVWTRNKEGKLTFCNTTYAKFLETQPHQVLTRQWELIDGNDAEKTRNLYKKVFEEKNKQSINVQKICKGCVKNFAIIEAYINDKISKFNTEEINSSYSLIGTAFDTSSYQEGMRKKEENLLMYQEIVNSLEIPFCVLNSSSRINSYNSSFINLLDVEEEWIQQKPLIDDLLEKLRENNKLPEYMDFLSIKETCHQWIENKNLPFDEIWHMPSGSVLNISARKGVNQNVLVIIKDVSQILNLESRYKSLKSVWKVIVEQSQDALLIIGLDHRIQKCSFCIKNILKLEPSSILGMPLKEFLKTFAEKYNLYGWQEALESSIEMRNPHIIKIIILETTLLCRYTPLPDGGHMLCFSSSKEKENEDQNLLLFN